jgi:hypothetical protein
MVPLVATNARFDTGARTADNNVGNSDMKGPTMSTTTTAPAPVAVHPFITYVADRAASREVEGLADYYGIGQLIVAGELTYDVARDSLTAAFAEREMSASTAKVYVSQGYALAQLFATFDELEEFADEECKGSRSMKRIYDATRVRPEKADEKADADEAAEMVATALVDVVLAGLANLTDPADIARVRDAAIAMLAAR